MQEKEDRTKCEKLKSWNLFIVLFLNFNKYSVYTSKEFFLEAVTVKENATKGLGYY